MPHSLHQTAAALMPLLLAAIAWLPLIATGQAPLASAQGPVTATYALPLAA